MKAHENITLNEEIKEGIKGKLSIFNSLLTDNKEVAFLLINKLLLIGKGVIIEDLDEIIIKEYAHLVPLGGLRQNLIQVVHDLSHFIYGNDPLVLKDLVEIPDEEIDEVSDILRKEIEEFVKEETHNCMFIDKIGDVNTFGGDIL